MNENIWDNDELVKVLQNGGVAVMPTDTIYGMVGRAGDEATVNRIYEVRKRAPEKPCIILIGDQAELKNFSITLSEIQKEKLKEFWSFNKTQDETGAVSIVLDCENIALTYLHRGTNMLAFRMPASQSLRELLKKTGPLIAPSANTEKFPQSETVEDAKNYFGDAVDLYVDGGPVVAQASKVIRLHPDGSVDVLRA